jgi:hypothetical protein
MELPGSNYLLTLAVISITFVAFSTIVVVFREAQGGGLMEYEIVILRMFLVSGLEATIFSLIPPLLGLFGITPLWVWRVSSLVFALVMIWRGIYFRRRQTHYERRRVIDTLYAIYSIAILGLLINALGIFVEPNVAPYALAATWLLVNAIIAFILALERFLHPPEKSLS